MNKNSLVRFNSIQWSRMKLRPEKFFHTARRGISCRNQKIPRESTSFCALWNRLSILPWKAARSKMPISSRSERMKLDREERATTSSPAQNRTTRNESVPLERQSRTHRGASGYFIETARDRLLRFVCLKTERD